MYPVPSLTDLAAFSGRPEASYSQFGNNALIQATLMFTVLTEISDPTALSADDQLLANMGIEAYADYLYLRQPYAQAIAGPFTNETIGSYSYGKAMGEVARNAQASEVQGEALGVPFFDLAVRMLAVRSRAGGVFHGGIQVFEHQNERTEKYDGAGLHWDKITGRLYVRGPNERDEVGFGSIDINAQSFPMDPS
jgi:hypothetical protein